MNRISTYLALTALLVGGNLFAQRGGRGGAPAATGAARTSGDSLGPYDKQIVNPAQADQGKHLFATECVDCHGPTARGTDQGPNLVRSEIVLHDRTGSQLGPFLKKGHPTTTKTPSASFTDAQIADLSNFLKQRVDDALKRSPMGDHINIITGDVNAGKAYFNGDGKCNTCHSITAGGQNTVFGVAARSTEAVDLQQAMMFPGGGRGGRGGRGGGAAPAGPNPAAVTLTVTPPNGQAVTGTIVFFDDFDVEIRDASGQTHSWTRTPALKVVKNDPLQFHHELLDRITDKEMHDLVVYLETLK